VTVLRAVRLPKVEEPLGRGVITAVTTGRERLYWVSGFVCARTERELRRVVTLAEKWAEEDEERQERSS
jgi:hypothetical protein